MKKAVVCLLLVVSLSLTLCIPALAGSVGPDGSYTVSATATTITDMLHLSSLKNIYVEDGNSEFVSVDGVLFSADMSILYAYPTGREDTSYSVPDGVKKIGTAAFKQCKKLKSVELPESLEIIGKQAFFGCENLESITYPDSLRSIGESAFQLCSILAHIELPEKLTAIGDAAYKYCPIEDVTIPVSVVFVGEESFNYGLWMNSITILNPHCHFGARFERFDEMGGTGNSTEIIYGYAGSTAEGLATEFGATFESLGEAPEIPDPAPLDPTGGHWALMNGDWYYLDANGTMLTHSWLEDGGKTYWLKEDGIMIADGAAIIDGEYCWFDASGAWIGN